MAGRKASKTDATRGVLQAAERAVQKAEARAEKTVSMTVVPWVAWGLV